VKTTTITDGQSLLDVSLQELGSLAALFDLADANGLAITDALTPGQLVAVPASTGAQADLAALFRARRQRINTGDVRLVPAPVGSSQRYFSSLFFNTDYFA
jgi:hypothetical protein